MKRQFRITLCLLFACMFFSNAYAEEKVSREQVDTLVARILRPVVLHSSIYETSKKYVKSDKLLVEYLFFKDISDRLYEELKENPSSSLSGGIRYTGTYVYYRLGTAEFWDTFREYLARAKSEKRFDYKIADPRFSALLEHIPDDYPFLLKRAYAEANEVNDKVAALFVKTLMEYFSYDEFVASGAQNADCEMLIVGKLADSHILSFFDINMSGQDIDAVLKDKDELKRIAEYVKLSRTPLHISRAQYRETSELQLKAGKYFGETYDGVPDGEGTLTDKKGVKYFGAFKNGLRHGPVFVFAPEKEMVVQFWYNGKLRKDVPVSLREDGSVPEAVIIDGKRYGYGCYYNSDTKSTYIGFFIDGEQCGPGKIVTPEYTVEGKFNGERIHDCTIAWNNTKYKKNEFVGIKKGILRKGLLHQIYTNGTQRFWQGEFVDGSPDGEIAWCSISETDTTRYYGLFAYGNLYGNGVIERTAVHKDGMKEKFRYAGNLIKSRACGEGAYEIVLTDFPMNRFALNRFGVKLTGQPTGGKDTVTVKVQGTFFNNDLVEGKVTVSNGNFMMGRFVDGKLADGRMTVTYADGSGYDGECRDGNYNGYGKISYTDGTSYEGMFVDGSPVGMERNYMTESEVANIGKQTKTFVFDNLTNKKGVASIVRAAGVKVVVREVSSVEVTCRGKFKDDIMTVGKVTVSDGTWLAGTFEDGVLIKGSGKTIDKYGTVYTGEIRNGFPHGKGECLYKDGTVFKGNFVNGNRMGGTHYTSEGKVIKVYK